MQDIYIPKAPSRSTICAAAGTLVTIDGLTLPAILWATTRGLKWQTVKMRRLRWDNWTEALAPGFKRNTYVRYGFSSSPGAI